jgi:hypothetical protein
MAEQRRQAGVKVLHDTFFSNIAASNVLSQAGLSVPASNEEEIKPETILAMVNGKVFTAAQFTGIMKSVAPPVRANAMKQPVPFLEQYALMQRLGELAETEKLHEIQPFRGRLHYNRGEILTQALVDDYNNNIVIGPDEPRQAYDANPDRFRFAEIRALYIAYSLTPPPRTDPGARKVLNEDEARQRAEALLKEIQSGADFAEVVRNNSDDENTRVRGGQLPQLRVDDAKVPEAIRKPVFAAKQGDIVGPVKLPNGYYLVKVEKSETRAFTEVKDHLYEELRAQRFQKWFDGIRNQFRSKSSIRPCSSSSWLRKHPGGRALSPERFPSGEASARRSPADPGRLSTGPSRYQWRRGTRRGSGAPAPGLV